MTYSLSLLGNALYLLLWIIMGGISEHHPQFGSQTQIALASLEWYLWSHLAKNTIPQPKERTHSVLENACRVTSFDKAFSPLVLCTTSVAMPCPFAHGKPLWDGLFQLNWYFEVELATGAFLYKIFSQGRAAFKTKGQTKHFSISWHTHHQCALERTTLYILAKC